jgi:hypothetical protein
MFVLVLCCNVLSSGFATDRNPVQGVLPSVEKQGSETLIRTGGLGSARAVEPQGKKITCILFIVTFVVEFVSHSYCKYFNKHLNYFILPTMS